MYELIEYMRTEFGDVTAGEVHKGENVGWYLDQRLVSILISDLMKRRGPGRVKLVSRNTDTDRYIRLILRINRPFIVLFCSMVLFCFSFYQF